MANRNESQGIMKSIFAAQVILVLHILVLMGIGCMVIFFGAIVQYMAWILVGGVLLFILTGWLIRRRMIQEGKNLREILSIPGLSDRNVEISVLGGMASLRLEKPEPGGITSHTGQIPLKSPALIETSTPQLRELAELVELLNQELITPEEYARFKAKIMNMEQ